MGEIIDLAQIEGLVVRDKKRVLVGGCFDIIHIGHLSFLNNAKAAGEELWVILESDVTVKRLKGEGRPINSQRDRAEMLINLRAVDYVVMLPEMKAGSDYDKVLTVLKPKIIAITEGDKIKQRKAFQAKSVGAELLIIPSTANKSTSRIIELLI